MTVHESAFVFDCEGDGLVGVIAAPEACDAEFGVLVIVGGPQYRVGSHRQFVLLARMLAQNGIPCMRFDYRGMGDSSGESRSFENVEVDIRAAVNSFCARLPSVRRVVLWGLCDGASAACFYAPRDGRVAGLVLLNPWVRTIEGEARTRLRHYYLKRLFDAGFWRKLLGGGVRLGSTMNDLASAAASLQRTELVGDRDLPSRMADALGSAGIPFVVFLSRRDYVAREFEGVVARSVLWQSLMRGPSMLGCRSFDCDHTFSSAEARNEVAVATLEGLGMLNSVVESAQ